MSPGHALTFGPTIMAWSLGLGHEPRACLASPGHALTFGPRIMAWSLGLGHEPRACLDLWPYNYGLELGPWA